MLHTGDAPRSRPLHGAELTNLGVTECVLQHRRTYPFADYSEGMLASCGLSGYSPFPPRQDAQSALSVGTDRTRDQSPAALETNDAGDTRIHCHEIPPLGQPGTTDPRRICHDAPQVVAVGWRGAAGKPWQERDLRVPRLGPRGCGRSACAKPRPHVEQSEVAPSRCNVMGLGAVPRPTTEPPNSRPQDCIHRTA